MAECQAVMSDPAYRGTSPQARQLQRKALELSTRIEKARSRAARRRENYF